MKQSLLLTFSSPDRPGIVELITSVVVKHGGNWEESRLARLCGDFAGIARVSVPVEQADLLIRHLENSGIDGLHITVKRTGGEPVVALAYRDSTLCCAGADHEGIVSRIAAFLAEQAINVEEMETAVRPAPTTGTPVFEMNCRLSIPVQLNADVLRARLRDLAGELAVDINLDDIAV
jgi:glycine cleavage system regulatory protein